MEDSEKRALCDWPVTRRDFVKGASALVSASALGSSAARAEEARQAPASKEIQVSLHVNGEAKNLNVDPRTSLLDLLRENLKLTGTKKGCDHGQCGACTVLADGRRINSCLALAVSHDGAQITTIEGLANAENLDAVQQAFLDHDGFQCGYCTPGQIISAVGLLEEARRGSPSYVTEDLQKAGQAVLTPNEIRERMSGNLCRCGAYPGIVAAVSQAYRRAGDRADGSAGKDKSLATL